MDVAPFDLCAGMLPLAQLGLHVWLRRYVRVEADSKALVVFALKVNFAKDKVLNPSRAS